VTRHLRPGPGIGGELVEHPETFLTTADVARIRADERRATVERLKDRIYNETTIPVHGVGAATILQQEYVFDGEKVRAILDEEAAR
jgi:hypothetical protein